MICKLTTTLTGFIYFASSFLFLDRDVALGESEDSLLLDKRASGRLDFLQPFRAKSPLREKKGGIWEPPGKDSEHPAAPEPPASWGGPPLWALPMDGLKL